MNSTTHTTDHVKYRMMRALSHQSHQANASLSDSMTTVSYRLTPFVTFLHKLTALFFACTVTFSLYALCDAGFRTYAINTLVDTPTQFAAVAESVNSDSAHTLYENVVHYVGIQGVFKFNK